MGVRLVESASETIPIHRAAAGLIRLPGVVVTLPLSALISPRTEDLPKCKVPAFRDACLRYLCSYFGFGLQL
jgi:hypothetical protein